MQGRKPTPTALKLVTGNPGKRPVSLDQFSPGSEIPTCPRHLKGAARTEWSRVTKLLHEHRMIAAVDRGALAMMCTVWGRYVEAEEAIDTERRAADASGDVSRKQLGGMFVLSPNKMLIQSPWLAVSNRAMEAYRAWCSEFGLTPAQRTRIAPQTSQLTLPGVDQPKGFEAL